MQEHEKPWSPLALQDAVALLADAPFPWWIAGGIAIELAVGRPIRDHADIDVLVLRRDHIALRALLAVWDCWVADPPGTLRFWPVGQELGSAIHDIWCRRSPDDDWQIQFMIDEADEHGWVSRRDPQIHAPIQSITRTTTKGVPYLAPHIQIFYKAKRIREKDEVDFDAVLKSGINLNSEWLRHAIIHAYGANHRWLERLPA